MGRWFVILCLAVVQCPDAAMASSKSPDVPLWKRLLSALTPTPAPRERVDHVNATARPKPQEPIARSQAREPVAGWQVQEALANWPAQEPVAGPQARQFAAESQAQAPLAGWQVQEPVANWPAQEPDAAPQARQPVAESQAQEAVAGSEAHAPVANWQAQEPTRSNATGCNGGRRIMSAFYSQGRRTASGELFDPRAMTAAHRTLPFGTRLTVTNPRTGKSVIVVVNDRGPFISGVSLDLSLGAAQAIGMHGTGTVCIW